MWRVNAMRWNTGRGAIQGAPGLDRIKRREDTHARRRQKAAMSARVFRLTVAVLTVVVVGVVAWLLVSRPWDKSKATAFGWPATLNTVAGNGERGFADGAGQSARFSDPFAVAIDAKGALYVADAGETNRIRKIEPDGRTTTLPGAFDTPSGLAVDAQGNVYVADTGANLIRKISRDGAAGQAQFNGPIGIAVDKSGNVYVADTYNDGIRLITATGQVRTLAGGAGPGFADGQGATAAFDTPCGLALDRDGALLIADTGNDAIRKLGKDGVVTTLAHAAPDDRVTALREPIGLAATKDGKLYIASFRRGRILQLSPSGELRLLTGSDADVPENRTLRLAHPAGLAIDRHGALYIAEAASYAIRKLTPRQAGAARTTMAELTSAPPALLHANAVPWPLNPQGSWHEVVGNMGEVRGARNGDSRDHLHAGLDVRADVGQTVLAVADEKVEGPLAAWNLDGISEGLQIDQLTYIHMRVGRTPAREPLDPTRFLFLRNAAGKVTSVRVKRGTRFHVGDPLGTVNGMAHVHLELGSRGGDWNPMGLRFPDLADHIAPRVSAIQILDATGRRLMERDRGRVVIARGAGALSIVVDAWDQVDGDSARRRLGLYRVGYQILNAGGAPVKGFEQPLITLEFDRMPVDGEAAKIVYAPDSGETVHGASETHFLYVVTNRARGGRTEPGAWSPAALAPGDYVVRIFACDYAGNPAMEGRDLPINVR